MATNQKSQSGSDKQSGQGNQNRQSSGNAGNFANMDEGKQREAASKGGKSSHSQSQGDKH